MTSFYFQLSACINKYVSAVIMESRKITIFCGIAKTFGVESLKISWQQSFTQSQNGAEKVHWISLTL